MHTIFIPLDTPFLISKPIRMFRHAVRYIEIQPYDIFSDVLVVWKKIPRTWVWFASISTIFADFPETWRGGTPPRFCHYYLRQNEGVNGIFRRRSRNSSNDQRRKPTPPVDRPSKLSGHRARFRAP